MSAEARLALGLGVALVLSVLLTPVAIRLATRWGFHDQPGGYKTHRRPTPYLGGAAVTTAFVAALLTAAAGVDAGRSLLLAGCVLVLWGVGTVDDRRTVTPGMRVAVEAGLATALWVADLGWDTGAPVLDLALTVAWVVVVVNAVNLFDNMDGAAATVVGAVAAATAGLGLVVGDAWLAACAGALAGACLGFLPYNLAGPARIFLGDGGSMPIGFAAAALAMAGAAHGLPAGEALPVAVLLLALPLLDTALVIVSRRRRGVSILTGGHDHLTYRVLPWLGTPRRVAAALAATQVLLGALAVAAADSGRSAVLAATAVTVLVGAGAVAVLVAREPRAAYGE